MAAYQPAPPMPREFFKEPFFQPQRHPPELRQPAVYSDGKTRPRDELRCRVASANKCAFSLFSAQLRGRRR